MVEGSDLWPDFSAEQITLRDNTVTGSVRAGLLVVADGAALGGRIALGTGRIEGNGRDAVVIGEASPALVVEGIELEQLRPEELAPPSCEGGCR